MVTLGSREVAADDAVAWADHDTDQTVQYRDCLHDRPHSLEP